MRYSFASDDLKGVNDLIRVDEAWHNIIDRFFGNAAWRAVSMKSHVADQRKAREAIKQAQALLLDRLYSGALKSWLCPAEGRHPRLPSDIWGYWDEDGFHWRTGFLDGKLLRLPDMVSFNEIPSDLCGRFIWLRKRDVSALLGRRRGRPTLYDWPEFEKEAWSVLENEGGCSAEFPLAKLDQQMAIWADSRWPKTPGRSSRKERLAQVIAAYERARVQ